LTPLWNAMRRPACQTSRLCSWKAICRLLDASHVPI